MFKKILALDLGTTTGWASNIPPKTGVVNLKPRPGESPGMRFIRFERWLEDKIIDTNPDLIVFEQTLLGRQKGNAAVILAEGMKALVLKLCAQYCINHTHIYNSTLKKWATGYGRAGKDRMIKEFEFRYGYKPLDDNEADAGLILEWAKSEFLSNKKK